MALSPQFKRKCVAACTGTAIFCGTATLCAVLFKYATTGTKSQIENVKEEPTVAVTTNTSADLPFNIHEPTAKACIFDGTYKTQFSVFSATGLNCVKPENDVRTETGENECVKNGTSETPNGTRFAMFRKCDVGNPVERCSGMVTVYGKEKNQKCEYYFMTTRNSDD
jgi:hypothetical protein